jgi:hypothetical protein
MMLTALKPVDEHPHLRSLLFECLLEAAQQFKVTGRRDVPDDFFFFLILQGKIC